MHIVTRPHEGRKSPSPPLTPEPLAVTLDDAEWYAATGLCGGCGWDAIQCCGGCTERMCPCRPA